MIRAMIDIDERQYAFVPERGTTDAIFHHSAATGKNIWPGRILMAKNHILYFAFVDLQKAFDRVPHKVLWWAMRSLGIDE